MTTLSDCSSKRELCFHNLLKTSILRTTLVIMSLIEATGMIEAISASLPELS
ncbi:hypothetical protein NEPTK9_000335 [Candidatus Neptunochlamydia vexilliferae]|uniref:Uncharacterized protein n=1 Tax=Candidatus Neptunichlamydia vexilliferae TaxID=1651774 RepID=A0ABS0AZD5_9BACT|nr:hypothetical protein [Candidatus Neptunochlamydia vexilliferae]